MQQITFTVRTLTPLFLAGADPAQAEIRAPSFRGLMRYWHRALVGGIEGADDKGLEEVTRLEKQVFGDTKTSSAVTVRVFTMEYSKQYFVKEGTRRNPVGKDYLFWSMAEFKGKDDKPCRQYFPEGSKFEVILSVQGKDTTLLHRAVAAFWLLTHLGGIGSRSRRCAGSVSVQVEENTDIEQFPFEEAHDIPALEAQFKQGIRVARNLYDPGHRSIRNANFDVIAPEICKIWILANKNGKPWSKPDQVINALGLSLQNYRQGINPPSDRRIFGLPLPLKGTIDARLRRILNSRRASPLLLRVTKLQGEQYVGVAVLFKTIGEGVRWEDYETIEDWIESFPEGARREVEW